MKLFPKPAYREVLAFYTDDIDLISEGIFEVTQLDLLEDFFLISQEKPDWMDHVFFIIIVSGHFEKNWR